MDRVENYLHVTTTNYDTINRLLHHGPDKVQLMVDGPVPKKITKEREQTMFMDCSLIVGWILENPVEFEKE